MAEADRQHPLPSPDLLAELIEGTSLCVFLTGSYEQGMPLLWVNEAFAQKTGVTAGASAPPTALGRASIGPLERVLADPAEGMLAVPALVAGEGGTFTLQCLRADGTTYWSHVTFTPRRDASGATTHFFGVSVDVSAYVDERSAQLQTLAVERRQRADLDLIAQTTELLGDLEYPHALRDIAELLRSVVPWAAFYLNDDGLLYAEGIDMAAPPGGRGRRHARYVDGSEPEPVDETLPAAGLESIDAVQDLLDGLVDGPVLVRLDVAYPPYSASGWLRRDLVRRVLEETGVRPGSVVVHAVGGRRQVLGLLVTWNGDQAGAQGAAGEALGEPDDIRTVVEVVARRAGTAIDNARLYAREHHLAEALQRAMLPEQADVTGLDVWTYYAPNAEHAQVGGDWYDVLDIDGSTVGLVIGDVVGHDVEAAAAMGQLRSVVRSYAYELTTPGVVLDRVDTLVQGMRIPRSASLVYATLRRRTDETSDVPGEVRADESWDMEYTRAGHLPPLLLRDGEVRQLASSGGSLVGFGFTERRTAHEVLFPGDVLLFYTDGLIERRDRSLKTGLDALVETSARITARDAAGVGEELLSRLADAPEDDVAIVVVRLPDPVADASTPALSPRSRRWVLPSEPASIARARHAVVRSCQAWGLPESASAELVVSELVANGVLHGWGHIALRLFDTGDGLRIEVEDANPAPPVTTDGHPNRVGGFGMQIVERLADWGWRPAGSGKLVWARLKQPTSSLAVR
ncbi:PAS domain-containing protein [Xylanimonas allomyrinae]|uniref:PAS domain-containing protein n=1 Tax=Xylanimonas allomyrinae TaxID=2509459 RepID=A0A4P6EM83_9MICO|nr:SpoIIE family protein phosphatase [Xylanimonas allomyrinae]QAY63814.1 PAS domain-containing protein [Xylanimonas allomyrinae]